MSARSGNKKARIPRVSRISQPLTKKRKFVDNYPTPAMEKLEMNKLLCDGKIVYLPTPLKSQNDKKEYRYDLFIN